MNCDPYDSPETVADAVISFALAGAFFAPTAFQSIWLSITKTRLTFPPAVLVDISFDR